MREAAVTEGGVSPVPREARAYQGRSAGVVTRLVAAVIDAALVSLALGLGYAGLAGLLFMADPRNFSFPDTSLLQNILVWLGLLVVYLSVAWAASGRTYGCLVMGLRVVGPRGKKLRLPGAALRAVLYAFFPIGLLWCAVNRHNHSLQDVLLRTAVVYDWQPRVARAENEEAP